VELNADAQEAASIISSAINAPSLMLSDPRLANGEGNPGLARRQPAAARVEDGPKPGA